MTPFKWDFSARATDFATDRRGTVAILFGLALIPVMALVLAALDYVRAAEFRTRMHREVDSAALTIAMSDSPNADATLAALRARLLTLYGAEGGGANPVKSITITQAWQGSSIYNLTMSASFANSVSSLLPGVGDTMALSVTTSVKRNPVVWRWSLPTITDLSYEAADYNRISVYCYDDLKKNDANKGRRMETLTPISDNGGTNYSNRTLPTCNAGETLSYQLRNVRNSRTTPANWDKMTAEHYLYYTDTKIDPGTRVATNTVTGGRENSNGTMTMTDLTSAPILETILCDTQAACKSKKDGGILPNNNETGRTANVETKGCAQGKYMYFGWEDRPPTSASASDRDYDDIRIVVSCPTLEKIGDKQSRIIR